jgi:hypothetical protein
MPGVRGRIFVQAPDGSGEIPPSSDINPWLDELATAITEKIDNLAPEVYGSLAGSKTPFKPFIVGFIPPDVVINHIPIEQQKATLARVGSQSTTTPGQSVSGGKTGPMELVKTQTIFSEKALGNSIYNNLKKRNFSESDARRLTPLLVGHARAELATDGRGNFKTDCFNIGNVHSQGPRQGGYYYRGTDTHGSSESVVKNGQAKAGQKYETYYVGATNLDDGVDRWVGATLGWKQTRNATNGQEFARALRPDLFPESRGGNNGPYFTAGSSPDDPLVVGYGRNVQGGADAYKSRNPDPTQKDPNGIFVGGPSEVTAAQLSSGQANVMTTSPVTTLEDDDPIAGRTGRNIRQSQDPARLQIVARQVAELQAQVKAVQATPALYMLIAPQSFNRSYEHSIDAPKGRRRHIVHMWLEKPMTITCKGVTAAQYIFDSGGTGGLTNKNRVHTLSYANLMSLVRMYKNNGFLYTQTSGQDESRNGGVRQIAMSIFIYFDGHVYIGSFDDFSITDTAEKPYNLEYSFKFTVRYDMEASSVTDAEVARSIGGR